MRQQSPPLASSRVELTRTKYHVVTNGVGTSVYIPRRLFRTQAEMHANLRQVAPKALFHFPLECRVKWFAGAGEGMVHAGRGDSSFSDRLRDNALDTRCAADGRGLRRS
jgi:hypothetical protein